jgi:hypothetical protein
LPALRKEIIIFSGLPNARLEGIVLLLSSSSMNRKNIASIIMRTRDTIARINQIKMRGSKKNAANPKQNKSPARINKNLPGFMSAEFPFEL